VFDPLAIVLVIATNQAFKNLKPVMSMYGEPKPEPHSTIEKPLNKPKPDYTDEITTLENEIDRIRKSGAIGKRTELAITPLQEKINSLKNNENQIEY